MTTADLKAQIDALIWFHSIDFGNGIVSPGVKSAELLLQEADSFFGAISPAGRSVLDVGAWNGFFSFEAKRRGAARVIASDKYAWITHLNGRPGFELARAQLGLDVEPVELDVGELTLEDPGACDIVLFAGVFYHLFEAPRLLKHVATLATQLLVVETHQDLLEVARPAMVYYPGTTLAGDASNYWGPNPPLIRDLLAECGYGRVFYRDSVHGPARGVFHAYRDDAAMAALQFDPALGGWCDLAEWEPRVTPAPPPPAPPSAFTAPRTLRNLARFVLGRAVRG